MTKDSKSKQRLVGAIVLISLAVIFLPVLVDFNREPDRPAGPVKAPPAPAYRDYQSRVVPIEIPPLAVDSDDQGAISRTEADESVVVDGAPTPVVPVASLPPDEGPAGTVESVPAALPDKGWVVQVASFSTSERARKIKAQLQKQGFVAYIEPVETPRGLMQRVRVGPQFHREEAEAVQQRLLKSTEFKGIVLQFP